MTVSEQLHLLGIVPVVKLSDAAHAVSLAEALLKGGLPCAEITFRTAAAKESIRLIREAFPQMLVGAGTVLSARQVDEAHEAGAAFIVTPGFNQNTVKRCLELGLPVYPGCSTPSAIEEALSLGLSDLKFFPAEQSGGLGMIKALCAPYGGIRFMPTGGITEENLNAYLACPQVLACGGSWMVKEDLISAGRFDEIERLTRQAVQKMLGMHLRHVGIYCESADECANESRKMGELMSLPLHDAPAATFVGTLFEVFKKPFLGEKGHIAIGVHDADRAWYHLRLRGYEFREETINRDAQGRMISAYLQGEFGGFCFHLLRVS